MDWTEVEITTVQFPSGEWRRTTLRFMDVLTVRVWQVECLIVISNNESTSTWEYVDQGDAKVKYREVR